MQPSLKVMKDYAQETNFYTNIEAISHTKTYLFWYCLLYQI